MLKLVTNMPRLRFVLNVFLHQLFSRSTPLLGHENVYAIGRV